MSEGELTAVEFARALWHEAYQCAKRADSPRPSPTTHAVMRLIEDTFRRTDVMGLAPGLTQAHLDAVIAVLLVCPVLERAGEASIDLGMSSTAWYEVLLYVFRIGTYQSPWASATNSPPMQNIPRTKPVKSFNFAVQQASALKIQQLMAAASKSPCADCTTPGICDSSGCMGLYK